DAQALRLHFLGKPVARLDLHGGHALGEQRPQAPARGGEEFVLARRARGTHGGNDAATGARDLLVARSGQARLELARAVAGPDQVRVAVDESGRDEGALRIVFLGSGAQGRWPNLAVAVPG